MKLWEKGISTDKKVEKFTIGRDNELDLQLARFDVLGTMAHITMLQEVGLLDAEELPVLLHELATIYEQVERGEFVIESGVEDVHSQVELMLTRKLGDMGKKVHSGRSRNDQVLVDLRLFIRHELAEMAERVAALSTFFLKKSEEYKDILIPGYTHLQVAMPSSFGLWFGAYAESLADDLILLQSAHRITNQNPTWIGSRLRFFFSFRQNAYYQTFRFRRFKLQRCLCTNGSWKNRKDCCICFGLCWCYLSSYGHGRLFVYEPELWLYLVP